MSRAYRFLLFVLFFSNLFVIVGFWFLGSGDLIGVGVSQNFLAFGRLYGLLAVFFALTQFILMGRTVWVERVFGLDRLSRVHRMNGYFTFAFILLHVVCILIAYSARSGYSLFDQFVRFVLYYDDLWQAVISFILFIFVVGFSIAIARRRFRYEVWYGVHLATYLAIILAFGHQLELGGDFSHDLFVMYWYGLYGFVAGNVVLFRFLLPLYRFFFHRFVVDQLVPETHDATSVYISGRFLSRISVFPGQFFIFRFLRRGLWWQAHPFSLSHPLTGSFIRFTAKALGDFTSTISTSILPGTPVIIEGPFGTFTAPAPAAGTRFLFIAGGVGITPIRCLIEKLAPSFDTVLLYGIKTGQDIIFKQELDQLSHKYLFPVSYIASADDHFNGLRGRIDIETIIRLVPDFQSRQIYICGPMLMCDDLVTCLRKRGVSSDAIHFERFSW